MNRVWTFIISKTLNEETLQQFIGDGRSFVQSWTAHEQQLHGTFNVVAGRIVVVTVNEQITTASGCSIDKLTRFIKDAEKKYNIELLNRLLVAYRRGDQVEVSHAQDIKTLLKDGVINASTPVFNTAAASENELKHWEQPLKDTWLKKYLTA